MRRRIIALIAVACLLVALFFWVGGLLRKKPLKLPEKPKEVAEKVKVRLAKQIIAEQQQSRESLRRLVEGEIKNVFIDGVDREADKAIAQITCTYIDDTTLGGTVELIYEDKTWYLSKITREEASPPTAATAGIGSAEVDVGKKIVAEQRKHQSDLVRLVEGEVKSISIYNVDKKATRATARITWTYSDNSTASGTAEFIYLDGYWYITKLAEV